VAAVEAEVVEVEAGVAVVAVVAAADNPVS
jgi:hypothetical protein